MRGEGVQGVLTLFCSGEAQVCREDGDRQEEETEVESGEASQGECAMDDHADGSVNALRT